MPLIEDYIELQQKYELKYGDKTIVLYECGLFFEIYGIVNETETVGKIYEVADKVEKMKNKLYDKEQALETARSITKDIKYANTHMEIISKLGTLAEEQGLVLDEYQERRVFQVANKLESEIYELEEVFKDAIRDLRNKIDDMEEE